MLLFILFPYWSASIFPLRFLICFFLAWRHKSQNTMWHNRKIYLCCMPGFTGTLKGTEPSLMSSSLFYYVMNKRLLHPAVAVALWVRHGGQRASGGSPTTEQSYQACAKPSALKPESAWCSAMPPPLQTPSQSEPILSIYALPDCVCVDGGKSFVLA